MYGRRVPKTDLRVAAYGCVDELNAALGLVRAADSRSLVAEKILSIQNELITVMGELATAPEDLPRYQKDGFSLTNSAMVDRLTSLVDELERDKSLYGKGWAMPGNTPLAAALDFARAVCRRAERKVASLDPSKQPNSEILRYLNRLSDLCWLLARFAEKHA
jgi:cob(I)alamin adenosyltransferase